MADKETKENIIDPIFDGHPEKNLAVMSYEERLDYLWELIEFSHIVKNRKVLPKTEKINLQDSSKHE